jgi:hypothetical protein
VAGKRDVIAVGLVFGDLAVFDAVDVDRLDLELPSGRRLPHELAGVRAPGGETHRDPVALAEGVVDLVGQIAERAAQPPQDRIGALGPRRGAGGRLMVQAVRGDELPGQVIPARAVVLP